jgi:hypothetical protein
MGPPASNRACCSPFDLHAPFMSGSSKHYPPRTLSERLISLTSLLLHNHLKTECI